VAPSAIAVVSALGSDRLMPATEPLLLKATPSDTMIVAFPWSYQWACFARCLGDLNSCANIVQFTESCGLPEAAEVALFANLDTVTIPADSLQPKYTYMFTSLIQREPSVAANPSLRSKSASVRVAIPDAALLIMQVTVTNTAGFNYVNRMDNLELECSHNFNGTVLYTWSLEEGELSDPAAGLVSLVEPVDGELSVNDFTLVIKQSVLVSESYTFNCRVEQATTGNGTITALAFGVFGEARISLSVNDGPSGGTLQVKAYQSDAVSTQQSAAVDVLLGSFVDRDNDNIPDALDGSTINGFGENGFVTLLTRFQVEALAWTDKDLPLQYVFSYVLCSQTNVNACIEANKQTDGNGDTIAVPIQPSSTSLTYLPDTGGVTDLVVYIMVFLSSLFLFVLFYSTAPSSLLLVLFTSRFFHFSFTSPSLLHHFSVLSFSPLPLTCYFLYFPRPGHRVRLQARLQQVCLPLRRHDQRC
jgi:hypothetical protein